MFRALRAASRLIAPAAPAIMRSTTGRSLANAAFYARPWNVPPAAATIDARSIVDNTAIDAAGHSIPRFTTPPNPSVPVTVAWGRRDLVLPVYRATLITRTLPHARVTIHRGLGHVPMTDDPQLVASFLLAGSGRSGRIRHSPAVGRNPFALVSHLVCSAALA